MYCKYLLTPTWEYQYEKVRFPLARQHGVLAFMVLAARNVIVGDTVEVLTPVCGLPVMTDAESLKEGYKCGSEAGKKCFNSYALRHKRDTTKYVVCIRS